MSKPIKADIVLPYKIYLVDHNLNEEKLYEYNKRKAKKTYHFNL